MKKTFFILLLLGVSLIGKAQVRNCSFISSQNFEIDVSCYYDGTSLTCSFSSPEVNNPNGPAMDWFCVECIAHTSEVGEGIFPYIYNDALNYFPCAPGQADLTSGSFWDFNIDCPNDGSIYLKFINMGTGAVQYSCAIEVNKSSSPILNMWDTKY